MMTPKHKKYKYVPPKTDDKPQDGKTQPDEPPQVAIRPAPFQVRTGHIITLHHDRLGAEAEVRWQRKEYGRTAVIVVEDSA